MNQTPPKDTDDERAASEAAASFSPARPGGLLRAALVVLPIFLWATFGATLIALSALAFRAWTRRKLQLLIRIWGRVPLLLAGVRVELHGREHLEAPGPKLFLFNHVSTLDLFLLAAYAPPLPCVAYKKEFRRIPGIGWALIALGMIEIDRSDAERAIESLSRAGDRLQAEKLTLMMAPEGTRSRRGGLQQFKKGPFHVAIATRAPIYPIIWRGIETLNPMGSWLVRSGEIRADCLAPMDTTGWETETIAMHIKDTREVFLRYLPPERAPDADSSP